MGIAAEAPEVSKAAPPLRIDERTFQFSVTITRFCHQIAKKSGVLRPLIQQLIRDGTSIGANVCEAQAAQSRPDFISKMNIALKEAREVNYWLRLLFESKLLPHDSLPAILQEAKEISLIIGAIVRTSRQNQEPP